MESVGHYIAGTRRRGAGDRTSPIYNPATGEQTGQTILATVGEVDAAVSSAVDGFSIWGQMPAKERVEVLFNYRDLLKKNIGEIAGLITQEHGKTIDDAKGGIGRGIEVVEYACGIAQMLKGEHSNEVGRGIDSWSVRAPLGVCVGITPFNFPAMVPMWMFPISIACGNSFILKPSERDPSGPIALAALLSEAGAPPGVLNVINGDKVAVDRLLTHPDVQAASFVGSTPIAEYVYKTGTDNGKRVQALGGAKNHLIVMPDANPEVVADAVIGAGYGAAGQRCMAVSVIVAVGEQTADDLVKVLAPKVAKLRVGPGDDQSSQLGPVITKASQERVKSLITSGVEDGADLILDGRDISVPGYQDGFFVGCSLFDKVKPDMAIYREEIFGPVLVIVRVKTYEEAKKLVIDHEYGNGAVIYTHDGGVARDFCQTVNIGMVGVNVPVPVPVAYHSFGGWKRSLFGDHHMHGPEGIRFNTRYKMITTRWPENESAGISFRCGTSE